MIFGPKYAQFVFYNWPWSGDWVDKSRRHVVCKETKWYFANRSLFACKRRHFDSTYYCRVPTKNPNQSNSKNTING